MSSRIADSVFCAIVLMATVLIGPIAFAQVFSTPKQAATDPDFLVQGEYAGIAKAMQVVARGDGDFEIVVYEGGLPGAGWDKQPSRRVDGDADGVAQLAESMGLERIERKSPTLGASPPPGAIVLFDRFVTARDRCRISRRHQYRLGFTADDAGQDLAERVHRCFAALDRSWPRRTGTAGRCRAHDRSCDTGRADRTGIAVAFG